jgi:hypothetical protein
VAGDVVIPTRFDRPTIWPLLDAIRAADATPVIVHTETGHGDVVDAVNLLDERRNIQQWWNTGLDACGDRALVLNDDVEARPEAIRAMFDTLDTADLVFLAGRHPHAPTPLTGWCFGLRPDVIRPDPQFVWFYGDDDLYRRAIRDELRVEMVGFVGIQHVRTGGWFADPAMEPIAEEDRQRFVARWSA